MNQMYSPMSVPDFNFLYLGGLKIPTLLNAGQHVRSFIHLQNISLGTGILKRYNDKLSRILKKLTELEDEILAPPYTVEKYDAYRANVLDTFMVAFKKIDGWQGAKESKALAESIIEKMFDIEFSLRKATYDTSYRPNHESDQQIMTKTNTLSLTSAYSHLQNEL